MSETHRVIAIGDIHGCSQALTALIAAINPGPEDTLVPLGDFVDRGIDSRGVLDQLITLSQRCHLIPLIGNHEEMMIAARSDGAALEFWLSCGGQATLDSYGYDVRLDDLPAEHWAFLQTCRRYYENETHVFIHAKAGFRLADQDDGRPLWPGFTGKKGVVGHVAQTSGEIRREGTVTNIDTFCYGGGWLTGLEVHTGQVWQADERGRMRG